MSQGDIAAVVLAAGYSSRMGSFKPLLDLGGRPVVCHVVESLRSAGIPDIRAVVGYRMDALLPVLQGLGVSIVINERYADGMFSSVLAALKSPGTGVKALLLLPADIPLVRPQTLRRLAENTARFPGKILKPAFLGREGHPPLVPSEFIPGILSYSGSDGLRGALKLFAADTVRVAVADENILFDMDSPADYAELLERWKRYNMPSVRECEAIMKTLYSAEERTVRHCAAVADVAGKITAGLNRSGCTLDRDLIQAAALLHDIARDKPGHACEGARWVAELGYPGVAVLISTHMDISAGSGSSVSAAEVLYLADKLVQEDRQVSIEQRFGRELAKHRAEPEVVSMIESRYRAARSIEERVTLLTGRQVAVPMISQ